MRLALALDDLLDQSKAHGHKIGEVLQDITGNMVDFGRSTYISNSMKTVFYCYLYLSWPIAQPSNVVVVVVPA